MFLKKYKTQILIGIAVLCVIYLVVYRENFTLEGLTGNAPKELPLPSQLKPEDDKGRIGTYDKRFLDPRDIPTGFDTTDTDYLLSPETVQSMQKPDKSNEVEKSEKEKMKDKIRELEKQLEELKKTTQ